MAFRDQPALQLDPAHPRQVHVGNQAGRVAHATRPQELFGGCESSCGVAEQPQQMFRRFSNRVVVLDDRNIDPWQIDSSVGYNAQ